MPDAMIHGYRLDGAGGASRIGLEEAGATPAGGECLWIHLDYTQDASRDWIQRSGRLNSARPSRFVSEVFINTNRAAFHSLLQKFR